LFHAFPSWTDPFSSGISQLAMLESPEGT
jgi:hypothetical protein